jgi:hypothetical protein
MKTKPITHVSKPIVLQSTPISVNNSSLSWHELSMIEPLSTYKDVDKNYFKPIKLMLTRLNILSDKFYTNEFTKQSTKNKINEYLKQYSYETAKNSMKRLLDVIYAARNNMGTDDYTDYLQILHNIDTYKNEYIGKNPNPTTILPWKELKSKLTTIHQTYSKVNFDKMLSCIYSFGYTLRPDIITKTVFGKLPPIGEPVPITFGDIPTFDLDTGRWYIGAWKSHGVDFVVEPNLLTEIKKLLVRNQKYLLVNSKNNNITRSAINDRFCGTISPTNCRKSFITWFILHREGQTSRSLQEVHELSNILGNTVKTMWDRYLQIKTKVDSNKAEHILLSTTFDSDLDFQ